MRKILLAGATGTLGRLIHTELTRNGYTVRTLSRRAGAGHVGNLTDAASLRGCCDGIEVVISCAGASMDLMNLRDRASFTAVDLVGNQFLLHEALRAGVGKFVYVSVHAPDPVLRRTEYVRAHHAFAARLTASGLPSTVVEPTGFFSFLTDIFRMAGKGRGVVIGPGTARTNPIHEADVARLCVEAIDRPEPVVAAGGPETFTRREIVELAFELAGREPRILSVPPGVMRASAAVLRPFNPRLAALLSFGTEVSLVDAVAPAGGTESLRDYFHPAHMPV